MALACLVVGWVGCAPSPGPAPRVTKPVRIVSLTLATDEILAEIVPKERVVAVTTLADDPEISNVAGVYPKGIPRLRGNDLEPIVTLAPDLVCVAPYNTADFLSLLERSKMPVFRNDALHSIDEIEAGVQTLGERVGEPGRAKAVVERMEARRRRLADRIRGVTDRPRVLYWSAGFTSGSRTTIDDIIREAGGRNVAEELELDGSAEISPEKVVAADPDVILLSRWKEDERQSQVAMHPILRHLRAVREGRVIEEALGLPMTPASSQSRRSFR
ncbi:ABC transporter substrate-binding protein [Singulisphaera rosea]